MSDKQQNSEPRPRTFECSLDELEIINKITQANTKESIAAHWKELEDLHKSPVPMLTDDLQTPNVIYLRPASLYDASEEIYQTRETYLGQIDSLLKDRKSITPPQQETVNTLWYYLEDMHKRIIGALSINGHVYNRPTTLASRDFPFQQPDDRK